MAMNLGTYLLTYNKLTQLTAFPLEHLNKLTNTERQ